MIDEDWNTPRPAPNPNAETQSEKCDRLLRTFKWEIGNMNHIRDVATSLGRERKYKTVNKKRVDELEKRLISSIEYANKKQ